MKQKILSIITNLFAFKAYLNTVVPGTIPSALTSLDVNLGYEIHRGALIPGQNGLASGYAFKNIRYGQAPVGELRFAKPLAPTTVAEPELNDGSDERRCIQQIPYWAAYAQKYLLDYAAGKNITKEGWTNPPEEPIKYPELAPRDPAEHEDCLFLDVWVDKDVYDNRSDEPSQGEGAPVIVWFFGGGYGFGYKDQGTERHDGLNERARKSNNGTGLVYVDFNYRVGAFGWLAGSEFAADHGIPNVGLFDQRLALKWVKDNIARFGGDPDKVTVMGESAGASSILHQITASGALSEDTGAQLFHRAILQSPAFFPVADNVQPDSAYLKFLTAVREDVHLTLEDLRSLPEDDEALIYANRVTIQRAPYGQFVYGPVVDGWVVSDLPGRLLREDHFDHGVQVMVGYNSNEGLLFTPPYVQDDAGFEEYIRTAFPMAVDDVIDHIKEMYPPVTEDEDTTARDRIQRLSNALGAAAVACNTYYLNDAFANATYSYMFSLYPGFHSEGLPYIHWPTPAPSPLIIVFKQLAWIFQQYLVNFAIHGDPNGLAPPDYAGSLVRFEQYGSEKSQINMDLVKSGLVYKPLVQAQTDPLKELDCQWWQRGYYY
ncbi:hypothetical protein MMC13_004031 [Lambiella insularis]|nr:hypothetical protein [Lambiella insularis]